MNELNWQEGYIKLPTIYSRNPNPSQKNWVGMVAIPALQGMTTIECDSKDEIEKRLRTSTVMTTAFFARQYDICRKRAIFLGEKSDAGWWFTILGIGLSHIKGTWKVGFINAWKDEA